MSDVPAYMSRETLLKYLDICSRTLDNYLTRGFPRPKKNHGTHPRWKRAEVDDWMDRGIASEAAASREAELKGMITNGHQAHIAKSGRHVLGRPGRVRGEHKVHQHGAEHAGKLPARSALGT